MNVEAASISILSSVRSLCLRIVRENCVVPTAKQKGVLVSYIIYIHREMATHLLAMPSNLEECEGEDVFARRCVLIWDEASRKRKATVYVARVYVARCTLWDYL